MKKTIALLICTLLVATASAQTLKIGYINIEKIIGNSTQYQQESAQLAKEFQPKKQELLDLLDHINLLLSNLQKAREHLSKENLQSKIENINKLELYFKKETELWQQQLTEKKLNALNRIQSLINRIIIKVAKDEKYDLILYQEVAFVSDEINISDMIIIKMKDSF
tara:strand:- start:248 stop:745 length:498 start_codon:yes stop_codon:yes gene_type:complete